MKGFTTPLATLHKFQGWADKFLTTPPNGIEDMYVNAIVNLKGVGALDTLALLLSYHDYDARADHGRLRHRSGMPPSPPSSSDSISCSSTPTYEQGVLASARNTDKLWAQMEFVW